VPLQLLLLGWVLVSLQLLSLAGTILLMLVLAMVMRQWSFCVHL
jgi:hypothetical protein